MSNSLSNILNFFRIPINLIRLEIIFASFFCFFFSLFIKNITDLEFNLFYGVIASVVFLGIIGELSLDRENGTKFTFRFDIKQEYEN